MFNICLWYYSNTLKEKIICRIQKLEFCVAEAEDGNREIKAKGGAVAGARILEPQIFIPCIVRANKQINGL